MAKELPYFQFEPAEYLSGDILLCSYEAQGVFVHLMAIYWQRNCELTLVKAERLLKGDGLTELMTEGIIVLEGPCDDIIISFLDKQYEQLTNRKKRLSEAGKKGAEVKAAKATLKPPLSQALATLKQPEENREEEIRREEKRREKKAAPKKLSKVVVSDFPWQSDQFLEAWKGWLIYRKEIKKSFKSERSEKTALGQLAKLTLETDDNGSDTTAIEIITRSIANSWTGLFALDKSKSNGQSTTAHELKKGMDYINRKYPEPDNVVDDHITG